MLRQGELFDYSGYLGYHAGKNVFVWFDFAGFLVCCSVHLIEAKITVKAFVLICSRSNRILTRLPWYNHFFIQLPLHTQTYAPAIVAPRGKGPEWQRPMEENT